MIAVSKYSLDTMGIGDTRTITGEYTRKFHVKVSNRAQNYAKRMRRLGTPVTFTTERSIDPEGVIIRRVFFHPPVKRLARRKKKRQLQPQL